MSGKPNVVKVKLRCRNCGDDQLICVTVRVGVHPDLRCDHPHHGHAPSAVGGDHKCQRCDRFWIAIAKLAEAVVDVMHRDSRRWRGLGHVVLEC